MIKSYDLEIIEQDKQLTEKTFLGGKPYLPANEIIPVCELCSYQLTFFLQVTFPDLHEWNGLTLSLFACTNCHDDNYLIPEMLTLRLQGVVIPDGFLKNYQKNFRVIVFNHNVGVLRKDYEEKIKFKPIHITDSKLSETRKHKLGGEPDWLLEDESPSEYHGNEMFFLLQIPEEYKFEILPNARGQIKYSYFKNTFIESDKPHYDLFLGNNLYFFGSRDKSNPEVYIITQI